MCVCVCAFLIGLFAYSHMEFEVDRDKGLDGDPPLHEMAVKALSILQKNNKGFFLFVESESIILLYSYYTRVSERLRFPDVHNSRRDTWSENIPLKY